MPHNVRYCKSNAVLSLHFSTTVSYTSKYKKVGVLPIRIVKSNVSSVRPSLDFTIRIGSTPTFSYFELYLYSAYAAHFVCILHIRSIYNYIDTLPMQEKNMSAIQDCF